MGWLQRILDWLSGWKPKPPPIPVPPAPAVGLVAELNEQRRAYGLAPFVEDTALNTVAQEWADQMAETGFLTHGDFYSRISAVYPEVPISENIAEGQKDVASVVASWMQSPGHRANILGHYTRVGWGVSKNFWVLDFAQV